MSTVVRRASANVADYPVLLTRLRETFALGQQRAEAIKVQTYWEAGRLLHEHLRHHEDEPSHGKQVMAKLAASLEVGDDLLYRMLRFYEAFPISARGRKLSWTHYRTLARLPDAKQRLELEARATHENWNAVELAKEVSGLSSPSPPTKTRPSRPAPLLQPKRGQVGLYRIVADGDGLAVDLGLNNLLLENGHARRFDKVVLSDWEE